MSTKTVNFEDKKSKELTFTKKNNFKSVMLMLIKY